MAATPKTGTYSTNNGPRPRPMRRALYFYFALNNRRLISRAKMNKAVANKQIHEEWGKRPLKEEESAWIVLHHGEGADILETSSSLTESEVSTRNTKSTDTSTESSWLMPDTTLQEPKHPPKEIQISHDDNDDDLEATCLPHAQLCFDPDSKELVTLMEVHFSSTDGLSSKKIRVADEFQDFGVFEDPSEENADDSESPRLHFTDWQTYVWNDGPKRFDEPIVLSTLSPENWVDDNNLDLYLLHECQDAWAMADPTRSGCVEALKRFVSVSKTLAAFKAANGRREISATRPLIPEPFSGIGYSCLVQDI